MTEIVVAIAESAVAVLAFVAIWITSRDTRRAAERTAAELSRRTAARQAELERSVVMVIAELHGAHSEPNIHLSPLELGRVRTAFDSLPTDRIPGAKDWFDGGARRAADFKARWLDVRAELSQELQRLTHIAATGE